MTTFEETYAQVVAEAEAEGPAAIAELRMFEARYRLASDCSSAGGARWA